MKTPFVYVLISSDTDFYLEELWCSLFSLRHFHPNANIKVLLDEKTKERIDKHHALNRMITEKAVIPTPKNYNAKQRSRQIKTTIRQHIKGKFIFIDTDTVICKSLDQLDNINCDIAAVPDGHTSLATCAFPPTNIMQSIFGEDVSNCKYWFNSGVMLVADNKQTHDFYKKWNENWTFSCFKKGNSQDQPALLKTDKDFGYIIKCLPDIYNCQIALSLKWFADAAIVHWWHMSFIEDQSYSPYLGLSIYRELKAAGNITPHIKEQIINCKQTFSSPSMPVGKQEIFFLFSPTGYIFKRIYTEGGIASFLMNKIAKWLNVLHRFSSQCRHRT